MSNKRQTSKEYLFYICLYGYRYIVCSTYVVLPFAKSDDDINLIEYILFQIPHKLLRDTSLNKKGLKTIAPRSYIFIVWHQNFFYQTLSCTDNFLKEYQGSAYLLMKSFSAITQLCYKFMQDLIFFQYLISHQRLQNVRPYRHVYRYLNIHNTIMVDSILSRSYRQQTQEFN